jgi:hypothetical protein
VQIAHVIDMAQRAETRMRRLEIEWQTKVLASFIANTASSEELAKDLLKHLSSISLADADEVASQSTPGETVQRPADTPREQERSLEDIIENGSVEWAFARNNQRKGPGLPFIQT